MGNGNYTLIHKNIPVADISVYEETGTILSVDKSHDITHLPIGVHCSDGVIDRIELNRWWRERCIPELRAGAAELRMNLDIRSLKQLVFRCDGLCLSDCYWIRPCGSNAKWEDVNFFENPFSHEMGDMLLGFKKPDHGSDLFSPDNTTEGCLRKRWCIIDGRRCLIKAGETPYYQQSFNEAIASMIMEQLGITHIPYALTWQNGQPYSVCEDFITPDMELVTAWRVMQISRKPNQHNDFLHYVNLCEQNGISDIRHRMDEMLVLDYIIANEDRHFNNFGIIRNVDTLEWIGAAPIFDSGTSLGYNKAADALANAVICKPFKKTHGEQLRLVSSFDWLDLTRLDGIEYDIAELLSEDKAVALLGADRPVAIAGLVRERIDQLKKYVMNN